MRMISKEMFCAAIKSIQNEKARISQAEKALSETLIDGWVIIKEGETVQTLIDLLIDLVGDSHKDSMIEWWLFDNVEKYIYNDKKEVIHDLTDVGALYDYLVETGES